MTAPDQGLFTPLDPLRQLVAAAEQAFDAGQTYEEVRALQRLVSRTDAELDRIGLECRYDGWTYAAIGDLFGMTRQGARQRFGSLR
jgi:DNA-directed RNA polymerase specialized sigma24 family protein